MNKNNELRVFISSTFRDLQEEREHLIKKIFPEIRALCRARGVTFTEVDLRWGLTNEEAMLGRIIRTCLEEVDKCRPYFIGMIGNRYGWVPEFHEILMDPDLLTKYPWIEEVAMDGASVTEMEFIHGVFDAPQVDGEYAFFYNRPSNIAEADDPVRLAALIERSRETGRPFREFESIEKLGRQVQDDLVGMIEQYWPVSDAPSELELERRAHVAFAASRSRAYIPNPLYLKEFTRWLAESSKPLVVYGESGLGKSSLMAYLADYYRTKNPTAFVIEHYVGASQSSGLAVSVMQHVIEEIRDRFDINDELPTNEADLEKSFPNWLFRCRELAEQEGIPVLIVVDAVNQLGAFGRRLTWLPKVIPVGIRLLISTTPGETEERLTVREWDNLMVTPIEDQRVRQSIVIRYLGEFHKAIAAEQVHRVTGDEKANSPLYLRVVAEELRLHGELETLDEKIDRFSAAADLDTVFQYVMERLEHDYSTLIVRRILESIWGSRSGMQEIELLDIVDVSRLHLSRILLALDYHLVRQDGRLGFFHDFLRRAVERRYLLDGEARRRVRERLAEYFESVEINTRVALELVWQYREMADDDRLLAVLSRTEVVVVLNTGEAQWELLENWARLIERGHDVEAHYRDGLARSRSGTSAAEWAAALKSVTDVLESLARWSAAAEVFEELVQLGEETAESAWSMEGHHGVGEMLLRQGEYDGAMDRLQQALMFARERDDRTCMAEAIGSIGVVYSTRGQYDEALDYLERSLAMSEEAGNQPQVAFSIGSMGVVHYFQGRYDQALECFDRQRVIAEELGNRSAMSTAIGNMGGIHLVLGRYPKGLECFERWYEIACELGDRSGMAHAIGSIAIVHSDQGRYDRALEWFERERLLSEGMGDRQMTANAIGNIGVVYRRQRRYPEALECYLRALEEHRAIGFTSAVTYWLNEITLVLLTEALDGGTQPLYLSQLLQTPSGETWTHAALRAGRTHAEECRRLCHELSRPDMLFANAVLLARIEAAEGNVEGAIEQLGAMLAEAADDEQRAELHYWLWKIGPRRQEIGHREEDRGEALRLYTALYATTPKYDYHKRIEELTVAGEQS